MSSQLLELATPFNEKLVQRKPGSKGGDYVSHGTVTERALSVVGAYSVGPVELIRGYAPEETTKNAMFPAQENVVVGALVTVRCVVDGREVSVTEAGDVENPLQKGSDGARAKDAISDGVKRCWMRLGLGLHLWSQKDYFLHKLLTRNEAERPAKTPEAVAPTPVTPEPVNTAESEPQRLGEQRGAAMVKTLAEMGFNDSQRDNLLLFAVTERDVKVCADLTDAEAKLVMREARHFQKEREAEKDDGPPFDPDPEPENFAPDGPGSRLLSNTEASNLHKALAAFGIKEHYEFASEVMGRRVNSLQACTVGVSAKIYEAAVYKDGSESQIAEFNARKAAA